MSFVCRIADISLTVVGVSEKPDFGTVSDGRSVSFVARIDGTTKDTRFAAISQLNDRLQMGADLIICSHGSTRPQALALAPGGVAMPLLDDFNELGDATFVRVQAGCARYARRANRVYLANPIGDEWPSSSQIQRYGSSGTVYADAGRWCISSDGFATELDLYFATVDDELLVIEFEYELVSQGAAGQGLNITAMLPDGEATYSLPLAAITTLGRGHYTDAVRIPASTAKSGTLAFSSTAASTVKAYIENVRIGALTVAHDCILPISPSANELGIPYGWSAASVEGATWSAISGKFTLIAADPSDPAALNYGLEAIDPITNAADSVDGMVSVVPGRLYGWQFTSEVTDYTSGEAYIRLVYFEADGSYLSATTLQGITGAVASAAHRGAATPPAGAAYTSIQAWAADHSSYQLALNDVDFGEHLLEAPGDIHLSRIGGEAPADLEIWGDVDIESDAHSVYYAIGEDNGAPYIFEAEELGWSGFAVFSDDSRLHLGSTGHTGVYVAGVTAEHATIDTSRCKPGAYLLLARALSNNAGYTTTVGCTTSGSTATTASTTPEWISLGTIPLPTRRTLPGVADTLTVSLVSSNASGVATVDRFMLVPLTQGGAAWVHPAAGTDYDSVDYRDGSLYLDGAVNNASVKAGRLMATARDRLIVNAEEAASDETTHLVRLKVYAIERYSLWR